MNHPMQCEVCADGIPRDTVRCRKHATEKACTLCGVVQAMDGFPRSLTRTDGRDSWCKTCRNSRAVRKHEQRESKALGERVKVETNANYTPPESCPKCGGYVAVEGDEYPHCAMCGWEDYDAPNPKIPMTAGSSLSSLTDLPFAGLAISRGTKP